MEIRKYILIILLPFVVLLVFAQNKSVKNKLEAPLFDNLGSHQEHKITTKEPLAQRFFDQGLLFYYAFEWGESIRSFREATRLDPQCAMCYWGLALALGSKANAPMTGHEYRDAKTSIQKAMSLSAKVNQIERDYINSLSFRFQHQPKPSKPKLFSCHTTGAMLDASSREEMFNYVNAMQKVTQSYPYDNDAKALYAFALFDLIDWKFWDVDGKINPVTPALIATLDTTLTNNNRHVGANHYYIHVIEQSPQPESALSHADRLKTLVPGSEHLIHMPTHIYFLTGRFHEASEANLQAIQTFKNYSKICRDQGFEPETTYLYHHNFDFLRTTATMEGRKILALAAARELVANLPAAWMEQNADLQSFIPIPYFVKARFGLWQDVMHEPMPKTKYQYALGMWHFARGLASARLGDLSTAEKEAATLQKIKQKGPSPEILDKPGFRLLTIASEVLNATIADNRGDEQATFKHLDTALKIQHDMGYHEPPDWYFPLQEALGEAYLKWNHPQEAVTMFENDLRQYPNNPWSLFGLAKALHQLNENDKAAQIESDFKQAWQNADIPEPISLFPLPPSS